MQYTGFSPSDEARVRRLVEAMPSEHTRHISTVRYGAAARGVLADAVGQTCNLYDRGMALSDVDLSSTIAHENWHCGNGASEIGAAGAQADYLAAIGQHGRSRRMRDYPYTKEYQDLTREAYREVGAEMPSDAFAVPNATPSTQHQYVTPTPAQIDAQPMTRRQRERERGAAVLAAVFGGGTPAPQQQAAAQVAPSMPQQQPTAEKPMTRRQIERERGAAVLAAVFGGKP